ncbi:hypothetical protein EYF80_065149 [Liparis tanakae]|uniref:Uncharacterized protein n=1 Tax=Liparis tanakae TaxID=230148 RepID=A0A4Z2E856_9TELE|nr:hypothetical protein EYF80_065149 [Liparis tanakae]
MADEGNDNCFHRDKPRPLYAPPLARCHKKPPMVTRVKRYVPRPSGPASRHVIVVQSAPEKSFALRAPLHVFRDDWMLWRRRCGDERRPDNDREDASPLHDASIYLPRTS